MHKLHKLKAPLALALALTSLLLAAATLSGCAGNQAAEEAPDEDAITLADATAEDLDAAFTLMASAVPQGALTSAYITGDANEKEVRATFTTEQDGTDARPLAAEAEALCAQYSLAVAQAALAREQAADDPDEAVLEQWQAIVDAEQQNVDSGQGAGGLYDVYAITAVIQTSDPALTLDGVREAGEDAQWRWQ